MTTTLRLLRPYLRPYRLALAVGLAAMFGEVITAVLAPLPVRVIFDQIIRPNRGRFKLHLSLNAADLRTLYLLVGAVILIAVFDALFTYLDLRQSARVAQLATTDLRRALFSHMQRLSLAFHQHSETRLGELQVRMSGDVQNLQDAVGAWPSNIITNGGAVAVMMVLLFLVNRWIGAAVLAAAGPVYLMARHYGRRTREATRQARRQEGRVNAMVAEVLSLTKLVQAFGQEERENVRLHQETAAGLRYGLQAVEYQARVQPAVALATSAATAAVLLVGALLVVGGSISVGALTMVIAYTRGCFGALRQLAKLSTQTQKVEVAGERLAEVLARSPAIVESSNPIALPQPPHEVSFDDVTFGYGDAQPVLHGISFTVPAGATLALVGATGAGKSSVVSLIPRLYDVWSGAVRINGVDVRDVSLRELRALVTMVLQESLLLRDTIWMNIVYGSPDASDAAVLRAAEAAGVTSFVDQLDDGLETMISERGASLSGGQKQCVAIARALLRDSPVVILDEPTSHLDSLSEQHVVRGLKRLLEGRTAIVIAHRLSTVRNSDLVAVLEAGRLVEFGPPEHLLMSDGIYRQLSALQAGPLVPIAQSPEAEAHPAR